MFVTFVAFVTTLLAELTWYDSYSPRTYAGAAAFCASEGSRLATLSEYCDPATSAVFGGRKTDGDQWAPFSGGGDNEWVQVGSVSMHAQCKQHTPEHGKPSWGTSTDAHGLKKYVLCAGQS